MTEIHLRHYSGGMVSEFHQLSEKVSQLAELAHSLRRENGDLRLNLAALMAENVDLATRMQEAHQRVAVLLEKMPGSERDEEVA